MTEDTRSIDDILRSSKARSWLKGYVKTYPEPYWDDLESEGLLAMSQAYDKASKAKNLDSYLIQAAKWHIQQSWTRRLWTGQPRIHHGGPFQGSRIYTDEIESLYPHSTMQDWSPVSTDQYSDPWLTERVLAAVNTLTQVQKERIFRKFWLDEAVLLTGGWWSDPRNGAKHKLRRELEQYV